MSRSSVGAPPEAEALWAPARLSYLAQVLRDLPRPLSREAALLDLTYRHTLVRLGHRKRVPGWKALVKAWGPKPEPYHPEGWGRTEVEAILAEPELWQNSLRVERPERPSSPPPAPTPDPAPAPEKGAKKRAGRLNIKQLSGG